MPAFANPLGLLALLGIPAVLAIHFLQRKAVEVPVATLFLLERTQREAASGRRLDRIVPSIPLWMQLLAVLLLTWFLAEPRFQNAGSVQRVAVVLDSSASMSAFKESAVAKLLEEVPRWRGSAQAVELTVLESTPGRPRIYSGGSTEELKAALANWQPRDGLIDPTPALRVARSLVSREGIVIYLTDTPHDTLPFEAAAISVGEAIDNVGFTGVSFTREEGALVWKALVRNYGSTAADRTWTLRTSGGSSEPRPLRLEPGAIASLQAAFPTDAKNVRIELSADRFPLDDVLPLVAPAPKSLALFAATSAAYAELSEKLLNSLDATVSTNDASEADLSITSYDPLDPTPPAGNSIVFVEDATRTGAYLKGGIIAESHPLMDGLNWQSLLVRETIELDRRPTDQVLLWQEKRALIFLRETPAAAEAPATSQLCFNFDLHLSNATRQPAFIVLLHRFAERVRDAKTAPFSANLETGQPIRLTTNAGEPLAILTSGSTGANPTTRTQSATDIPRAPMDPGFLEIRQNGQALLNAAVHFADTREADFTGCGSSDTPNPAALVPIERHTASDPYWRIWLFLLLAALLVSWHFTAGKRSQPEAEAA